ncbi:hypothetical protein K9B32_17855 [Rhizobium sp. 3T7]|uniref:hypothetical protein n=1 Tax=Rhizobium sp. 3T7 TaxID=2874922 RepID=UPI001CC9812B|nr:hypothetical protein [Rhizobium sp. 3T7]MBZ9791967.1 hypothetical protein [Rhizobium sp. 3T7]
MSCYDHPAVGDNPKLKTPQSYESFNPGEVRLYGRPAASQPKAPIELGEDVVKAREALERDEKFQEFVSRIPGPIDGWLDRLRRAIEEKYRKDGAYLVAEIDKHITLAIDSGEEYQTLPLELSGISRFVRADGGKYIKSIGVIYGYAYEGHCYKLPKPQIMFLPTAPCTIATDKCAYDCGYSAELGYAVWQVDKLDQVIALDIRADDVKTLVLDENMPGNRSPQAYSHSMSLAPMRPRE